MTGEPPFTTKRNDPLARDRLKAAHANDPVPALDPSLGVPKGVENVMRRLLEKIPAHRYDSAEAFIADLDRAVRGDSETRVDDRRPAWLAMAAVAALLLAGWLFWPSPARIRKFDVSVADTSGRLTGTPKHKGSLRLVEPGYSFYRPTAPISTRLK